LDREEQRGGPGSHGVSSSVKKAKRVPKRTPLLAPAISRKKQEVCGSKQESGTLCQEKSGHLCPPLIRKREKLPDEQ
jgi:hypothetical protein